MDVALGIAVEAQRRRIFLTGSTGYIGGRLAPRLLREGYALRCFVRSPGKLANRRWSSRAEVEIREGDLGDPNALTGELEGCETAYYLVDPLLCGSGTSARRYENLALGFARAAGRAGVRRIVYLGRMHGSGSGFSGRAEWGDLEGVLESAGVPVTIFRAPMIIGSGSASFEMLRSLVMHLPVLLTPKWAETPCQPIAVRNVIEYLAGAAGQPATAGQTYDIGGPEILSYREMLGLMAAELHRRRRIVRVPARALSVSAWGISMITPLSLDTARQLVLGFCGPTVCRDNRIREVLPQELLPMRLAIRSALDRLAVGSVETDWSMAGAIPIEPDGKSGNVKRDKRAIAIDCPPEAVFRAVCRIGGSRGWYGLNWLWRVRAWMDRLAGGPGSRGRRDPESLGYGEALDFWRVSAIEPDRRLSLGAEMKVPGDAQLDFEIEPAGLGRCVLRQSAVFQPRGTLGVLYWYAVLPFHHFVFRGMLRGIEREARSVQDEMNRSGSCVTIPSSG